VEMLFQAAVSGARIGEIPIIFVERRQGVSKLSTSVMFESLLTPWRLVLRRLLGLQQARTDPPPVPERDTGSRV